MQKLSHLESEIFNKLRKGNDRLASPFSKAFDYEAWLRAEKECSGSARDRDLLTCGLFVAGQLKALRGTFFEKLFSGLSKRTAIRLAMASANLEFFTFQKHFQRLVHKQFERGEPLHIEHLREIEFLGPGNATSPDDFVTAVVDAVPHWLFEAKELVDVREATDFKFQDLRRRCSAILSVEHALKNVWDAALWEGWFVAKTDDGLCLLPSSKSDAYYWHACQLRHEADVMARSIALADGELKLPYHFKVPSESVRSLEVRGNRVRFKCGPRSKHSSDNLRMHLAAASQFYLGPMLMKGLGGRYGSVTLYQLILVLHVLKDTVSAFSKLALPTSTKRYSEVRKLSLGLSQHALVRVVTQCLEIDEALATKLVKCLTIAPEETGSLFRDGLWSRPLVKLEDDELLLLAPAIEVGSIHRFMELHTEAALKTEVKKKQAPGLVFESQLRGRTIEVTAKNEVLKDFHVCPDAIAKSRGKPDSEEIDLLVRLGQKIIVCEAKAFIRPSEPIDRYNHLGKLEEACDQAWRKAQWMKGALPDFAKLLGWNKGIEELEVMPLVIVNQSFGSGLRIDGCLVTDINLWLLYLAAGSYTSSAIRAGSESINFQTKFYDDEASLIANIEKTFEEVPPLRTYLDAESWGLAPLPTAQGEPFHMLMPTVDASKMVGEDQKQFTALLQNA